MPSTQSKLTKLNLKPGFHRESTQYSEEGAWFDGDRVRFREGKPENLRGYEKRITEGLLGTVRDLTTWTNNNTQKLLALGTEQQLGILYSDQVFDVTPIIKTVSVGDSGTQGNFNTSIGSTRITVSITNHGAVVGDWIVFSSTSINGFATNGRDFSSAEFGGPTFQTVSVQDLNLFAVSTLIAAASTETNQGHGTTGFLLETGPLNNIQGLGYSAGNYVVEKDSGTATGTTTNKLVDSTQNFITTVHIGDKINNITDSTTAIITAIDSNTQLTLDTDIMASGEVYIIFDPLANNTRAWNSASPASNITFKATQWSLDNFGEDLLAVRRGSQLLHWDASQSAWPVRTSIVATGPSKINSIIVSPNDRHVLALGTNEVVTSVFNPLLVRWSDREDYADWTPSISSTSGELQLIGGTEIIGGIRTRNAIHVWTDTSAYALNFVGPPFIFKPTELGTNCGLVGPHAAIDVDGVSYWMGTSDFFVFDGRVRRLDCTIRRFFFDSFNISQSDKVYAGLNSEFSEVVWVYPKEDSQEPDSYIAYNFSENVWTSGTGFFTTYEDNRVFTDVITTGSVEKGGTSFIWNNEPKDVFDGDGVALTSFIESADMDIEDGDDLMFINKLIPDITINTGYLKFTITTRQYPTSSEVVKGPYPIDSGTDKIDLRVRGRQAKVRVSTAALGSSWQWGSVRLAMQRDGKR
tara:strand:+ start:1590 stop:3668 length:2079 start_codon:yes stop_codon:yes gene_type:complete